jgi:hypothetical protein
MWLWASFVSFFVIVHVIDYDRISGLMDSHNWFGRAPDSFRLFRCAAVLCAVLR